MEWTKAETVYASEEKAKRAAGIIALTESRLGSSRGGPQYEVETRVEEAEGGWQVSWRKVFVGYSSGYGGCGSCKSPGPKEKTGKVLPFKKPSS